MKSVSKEVDRLIHRVFKKQHPILAEVMVNWGKIVGAKFSDKAIPMKVQVSKKDGKKINILYIATDNASISMEMSYQQELIIERIAIYLGYKGIHKIRFVVR